MGDTGMTIYLSEHDAARLGIAGATPRHKRGRNTRPDIPSAGRAASTGLTTLIAPERASGRPAWSYAVVVGKGHRLYVQNQPALDTGWHPTELAACVAANELR